MPNPSPPEVGLRMARLWDAIRDSAARGGAVVTNPTAGQRSTQRRRQSALDETGVAG